MKKYIVTEQAGEFVAGKRSPGAGETIELNEEQAHYSLISGELKEPEKDTARRRETVETKQVIDTKRRKQKG